MAHYYNIVADGGVPIMMEDGQQFCVDGQSFHLVVQDVNNGVNGNTSFVTYASQENSDSQVFTHQALIEQHSTTPLNQGQSVYIINSDDIQIQSNAIKTEPTLIQTNENITNIVRANSKGTISNVSERQQAQWMNMSENNSKNQVSSGMKTQSQRTAAALSHLEQGIPDKLTQKMPKNRNRHSVAAMPVNADTSVETNNPGIQKNQSVNNKNVATYRLKSIGLNQMPPKPSARQPIRATTNESGTNTVRSTGFVANRSPPALHYPSQPLESLSERIKNARIQDRHRHSMTPQQAIPQSGNNNTTKQRVVNQQRRLVMTPTKSVSTNYQHQRVTSVSPSSTPEKTDSSVLSTSSEKVCTISPKQASPGDADSSSESFAYLQKVIDNPSNTIVQHQITGNTVKMLVVLPSGEQRLITFDLPNEDCTVQDLLEQAGIPFNGETVVSLVRDSILNINYIVESEAGTILTMRESAEPNEREVNSTTDNPHVSDDNSNSSVSQNEEPKFIDGKLAVCPNCGISSMDFNRCARCKTKLPSDVKQMPMNSTPQQKKEALLSIDNFYKKKSEQAARLEREIAPKRGRGGRRGAKVRPMKEPECLTLSSDEEEDDGSGSALKKTDSKNDITTHMNMMGNNTDEPDTILEKEPIITNNPAGGIDEHDSQCDVNVKNDGSNDEGQHLPMEKIHYFSTSLHCRTVRIGSYKYVPRERVVINQTGLLLVVPLLEDNNSFVRISIKYSDIVKVLIHFGKLMPVLFFYTNINCAAMIRELLGMQDTKGPYYDPAGKDHTHKRITLLPDKISEETKLICKTLFGSKHLFEELDAKEANDILVRASPRDTSQPQSLILKKQNPSPIANNTVVNNNGRQNEKLVQKMTVYPPPPVKGGIAINTEDYACLAEDQFLNDVIIDFYLKYLTLEVLPEADQQRTHVFSSYFYKRLTSRHAQTAENSTSQSPASKRHARVQKWTKNVNIFEKDFVIIPINEHAHWFLAIICFPGLVGTVIPPPSPIKDPDTMKKIKKKKEVKLQSLTIGSTTITPVATTITIDQADDDSERDEAEGDDEELNLDSDDDDDDDDNEESDAHNDESLLIESPQTPPHYEMGVHKSPCILIFDSLAGASRARVVATLRDYLSCEHLAKVGTEKTFSKDTIKGGCPKVPQQSNFTDCGLYLLQYVEHFFKDPIRNYTLPIKTLKNWFEEIVVTRKREELSNLLIKLMNETKGDKYVNLPTMQFPTQDGKLKPKPENSEKTELKVQKADAENRKKSVNEEEQSENTVQHQSDSRESMADVNARTTTTIYTIVPCSQALSSSSGEVNSMDMFVDVKPKPSTAGSTLAYLKNKRIPRLMLRDPETQESQIAAKKHKGDSYDSCK